MKIVDKLRFLFSNRNEEKYYYNLFVKDKEWNSPTPNEDESLRWQEIQKFMRVHKPAEGFGPLRILDVGSGRGWLTNLLASFGNAEGLEPVKIVVDYARRLFPGITFHTIPLQEFKPNESFHLIVSSEVIEHIHDNGKSEFVSALHNLLLPGGILIISTPRKEILDELPKRPGQPIEEWLTEKQVGDLFTSANFTELERSRIKILYGDRQKEVYQVWCFQRN